MSRNYNLSRNSSDLDKELEIAERQLIKNFELNYSDRKLTHCISLTKHLLDSLKSYYREELNISYSNDRDLFNYRIGIIERFVPSLWDSLMPEGMEHSLVLWGLDKTEINKIVNNSRILNWSHLDFDSIMSNIPTCLESFAIINGRSPIKKYEANARNWVEYKKHNNPISIVQVRELADTYIKNSWMRSEYIDWVFVDAIIGNDLVLMKNSIENDLWGKSFEWPRNKIKSLNSIVVSKSWTSLLIFFVLLLCYWGAGSIESTSDKMNLYLIKILDADFVQKHEEIGLVAFVSASYLFFYFYTLIYHIVYWYLQFHWRLPGKKSPSQKFQIMIAMYNELKEGTIHVPSIKKALNEALGCGISIDPRVLSIIDVAERNNPISWSTIL